MHGYHGQYRFVDLTAGIAVRRLLDEKVLRRFLGGVGLGTWILTRETVAKLDPLASESAIVFAFSPLVGTPLTTSAKFAVVAKSPLTQRLNDALSSSHFAIAGKHTGVDAIAIVGRCAEPSVLILDRDGMRIEPAHDLWGCSTSEATERLRTRFGPDFQTAVIGPAGENGVRFAGISHGRRHAGRGGLGAVMGAKRLKAIALRGDMRAAVADPVGVVQAAKDLSKRSFGPATEKYRELGTVTNLLTFNRLNALPTRNFQQGTFELATEISGEVLNAARRIARNSCAACTIGCEHVYALQDGAGVRLEYESQFALGPLCGIGDIETILTAARLCDEYGLDTISTGATIAFAMECAERGLLHEPGLQFGSSEALLRLIPMIAHRQGLGDLLAEGSRIAAQRIGGEAPRFAPQVKGLEIPGYDPRAFQAMALGFAVGSRGADHNRSGAYQVDFTASVDRRQGSTDSVRGAIQTEDQAALMDSLILCKFLRGVFTDFADESAELLKQVTGWDVSAEELHTTARRIITLKKLYNQREGWTHTEDTLPERFLSQGLPDGVSPGAELPRERLSAMVQAYYHERGWTTEGRVPVEQIAELELNE